MRHPDCAVLGQVVDAALLHLGRQLDHRFGRGRVDAAQHHAGATDRAAEQGLGVEVGGGGHHPVGIEDLGADGTVIVDGAAEPLDDDVGVDAEDLVAQAVGEAGEDRQHDDQGHDPDGDPGDGDQGDQRDESLFTLGLEVAQADEPFEHISFRLRPLCPFILSPGLGFEVGEENDVADGRRVGEQHHQPVDADALAGRGRHAVFEGADVIVVEHRMDLVVVAALGDLLLEAAAAGRRGRSARRRRWRSPGR